MVAASNMSKSLTVMAMLLLASSAPATEAPTDTDSTEPVTVEGVSLSQWEQTLADYRSDIVVVDFWATWCSSCLDRFPHMVTMSTEFKDQPIQFVSMLLEDPEESEAMHQAHAFLNKQFQHNPPGRFDHYFMNENLMVSFEKLDLLGIPAVFIYDAQGNLSHRLTGDNPNNQFTEADIRNALLTMLQTQP